MLDVSQLPDTTSRNIKTSEVSESKVLQSDILEIEEMLGKVALEEAWELPEFEEVWKERWGKQFPDEVEKRSKQMFDITHERLERAQRFGVGYQVLSHTAPGVQDVSDPKEAEKLATRANDYIAGKIKCYEDRLGAFA